MSSMQCTKVSSKSKIIVFLMILLRKDGSFTDLDLISFLLAGGKDLMYYKDYNVYIR